MNAPAMFRTIVLSAWAAAALLAGARAADAVKEGADDPAFRALEAELARAQSLSMEKVDRPYHLQGFVSDSDTFMVMASFGALAGMGGGRQGGVNVEVRVGSPELDNTNFGGGGYGYSFGFEGGPGGAPLEPDYDALRQHLWLGFDAAYKEAAEAIAKKRAFLTTNTVKDRPSDFGPAPVVDLVLPRGKLQVDRARWTDVVRRVSAVFRKYPQVYDGSASMSARMAHQYFLGSDGARHRFPEPLVSFSISVSTQAPDGMWLHLSWDAQGRVETDLPKEEDLARAARDLAERLVELAKAPTAEDYWGPVLFTGKAAAQFFLETVGGPLSNPRQDLGATQGGRLIDRLGRRIANRNLTARDDPTRKEWNGRPLLGYFAVDDDGVLPKPINLIENGVLKTYYMSRIPTKLLKETNGHSRAGRGSTGNLFIEARETKSREALEKQLLEMVKEEDLEYGLVVEEFAGGGFSFGGSGDVRLPSPAICRRLYPDGRRELVRGASFKSVPNRILKDIVAMGDDPALLNGGQFGQRVSVVAPSVLVEELELRRPQEEFQKPPYSERPAFAEK